jgi:hypothetical protein
MRNQNQNLEKFENKEALLKLPEETTQEEEYSKIEPKFLSGINTRISNLTDPELIEKANNKMLELSNAKKEAMNIRLPERNLFDEFNLL